MSPGRRYNPSEISLRILLVYPEFPDTFWSFKHALRFIRKRAVAPPLGLLTVAAMLPSEWEKRLDTLLGLGTNTLLTSEWPRCTSVEGACGPGR